VDTEYSLGARVSLFPHNQGFVAEQPFDLASYLRLDIQTAVAVAPTSYSSSPVCFCTRCLDGAHAALEAEARSQSVADH
jgi:hypothetical protein